MMGTANEEIVRRPKRWSAARKLEIVLRHLKGESLDDLSREIGVSSSQIEEWYHKAIGGMTASFKNREGDPLQADLDLAKKRIGELAMENELLREKSRKQGVFWGGKW
jgi:transposase-like protein